MPTPSSGASQIASIELEIGGRIQQIAAHDFLQSIEVESSTNASWTGTVVLYDQRGARLEDALLGSGALPTVRLRFNWEEFGLRNAPLLEGKVIKPSFVWMPDGIQITWEVLAGAVLDATLDLRTRAFDAGQRISDIVRSIAQDRGWRTTDERGNPTIEDTDAAVDHPFSTTDESDVRFINEQLRKQAVNADGTAGYAFYFDTVGAVHFHTSDFLRPREKTYTFGRDSAGEVISFAPANTGVFAAILGSANSEVRGTSSLAAAQTGADGRAQDGLDGDGDSVVADATAVPDLGSGVQSAQNIVARDASEMLRIAKDRRERASRLVYTAELDVVGTHDLRVFDFVNIRYVLSTGRLHFLSGRFRVMKIRHRYDNSRWKTTFTLARQGVQPNVEGTVSRQASRTTTPEEFS